MAVFHVWETCVVDYILLTRKEITILKILIFYLSDGSELDVLPEIFDRSLQWRNGGLTALMIKCQVSLALKRPNAPLQQPIQMHIDNI